MVRFPDEVWSDIVRMSLDLSARCFWVDLHKRAQSWPFRDAGAHGDLSHIWPPTPAHARNKPLDVLSSIRLRALVLDWEQYPIPSEWPTSHHNRGIVIYGHHHAVRIIIYPHQVTVHTDTRSQTWTARLLNLDPDFILDPNSRYSQFF